MLWKIKKSNKAIRKEGTTYKIALNTLVYDNNNNEEMLGTLKHTKNKDIPLYSSLVTPISNFIFINDNNLDLDIERQVYKYRLIAFNCNWKYVKDCNKWLSFLYLNVG